MDEDDELARAIAMSQGPPERAADEPQAMDEDDDEEELRLALAMSQAPARS